VRRVASIVTSAEWLIVCAMAPALLFPTPARLVVLALVPLLWWCAKRATGHGVPPTPLNVALAVLLGMVAVSLFATTDVRASLGKVAGVCLGVPVFWSLKRWITDRRRLDLALMAFVGAGAALALVGLLGTRWMGKFRLLQAVVERLPGVIRGVPGAEEGFQPNAVAGCLVLFIPVQVALLVRRWPQRARDGAGLRLALEACLLALTALTLLLTQSRGAWLGIAAASALALVATTRRRIAWAAAVVVPVALAVLVIAGPRRIVQWAADQAGAGMSENTVGRPELWSAAIATLREFPLTGVGMNGFRRVMPVIHPTNTASRGMDDVHAHNHLLQAGLDLGLPGLVAYLALWIVCGALLVTMFANAAERSDRTLARGLAVALLAHFLFGMTDAIPLGAKVGVLFWMTIALVTSLHRVALAPGPAPARP